MPLQRMELGSIRFYHRRGLLTIVGRSMTLEEQSMKKSFGKKLLAGIVTASMILGIPVAGATLPVLAFLLLAIYGKNIILGVAVVILGIGHIGIHLMHRKEIDAFN